MGSRCQQSLKEQCLIRSQGNKLEHFDKALGCGIPHQDPPGLGPGLWQGMKRALFFSSRGESKKGLLVAGLDRESRKGVVVSQKPVRD